MRKKSQLSPQGDFLIFEEVDEKRAASALKEALAKEKFGSTLTIKGSDEFRKQVIEVAVRNNLDVHFTDKTMNQQFEERKAELAIEREGQRIEQSDIGHP